MPTNEKIFAQGKLFELVHTMQPDGRVFEMARRAPGVRNIIVDRKNQKILLTKEFRQELKGWDYRLPGGKVFDSLQEYEAHRQSGDDIADAAAHKAKAETIEEAGIVLNSLKLFRKSTLGATVEWDLYVFESDDWGFAESGQQLEAGEQIEAENWLPYDEIEQMILAGDMREERIALILLQWIKSQKQKELK
jgi:8-oxo-dGTP pyrophosphatase MutT (NUDIX family)